MRATTRFKGMLRMAVFTVLAALPCLGHANIRFGPYEALMINSEVVHGVKVDPGGKIWLLLNPEYREREMRLKISSQEGASYRKWFTGEEELISAANQGKQPNAWTDWIETESTYIEYWMDGKKILHLKKVE